MQSCAICTVIRTLPIPSMASASGGYPAIGESISSASKRRSFAWRRKGCCAAAKTPTAMSFICAPTSARGRPPAAKRWPTGAAAAAPGWGKTDPPGSKLPRRFRHVRFLPGRPVPGACVTMRVAGNGERGYCGCSEAGRPRPALPPASVGARRKARRYMELKRCQTLARALLLYFGKHAAPPGATSIRRVRTNGALQGYGRYRGAHRVWARLPAATRQALARRAARNGADSETASAWTMGLRWRLRGRCRGR